MIILVASIIVALLVVTISNCLFFLKVKNNSTKKRRQVSILVPARNEEANIEQCVRTLITQGEIVAEILIYDDHSEDHTGLILARLSQAFPLIRMIGCRPLPDGWCGKNFACAELAANASGDWLLFIDADARLNPDVVARMIGEAETRDLTFVSFWPRFATVTLAEKILMPMLNFMVFSLYPAGLALLQHPGFRFNKNLGLAHGSCMLFSRQAYEQFGGHARVKDQIFEDTRIAQLWRENKFNGLCLDGQELVSLRMYNSGQEIWHGFQKNFYLAFTHSVNFWLFLCFHLVIFLLPFIYFIFAPTLKIFLLVVGILAMRLLLALKFKQSLISILFHPFAEIFLLMLGISSWWRCRTGKGVNWKGRAYQTSA